MTESTPTNADAVRAANSPAVPAGTTHLDLGAISLTFVPDGELRAEPAVAYPAGHEDIFADGLDVVDEDGMLVLSIGAILVTTPTRRVLVDVGIGDRTIPLIRPGATRDGYMRGGALLRNLAALGVEPEQIDTILLTHLHADHVGWIGDETATFPNAEYWVGEPEWLYWIRPENSGDVVGPRPNELDVIGSRHRFLVDGAEPVEGITAVLTAGHTPGHFAFAVQGADARAFIVGDALHCPAEALRPDLGWVGDIDGKAAVDTRRDLVAHVRGTGAVLVGPHFPNTVFMQYTTSGLAPLTTKTFSPARAEAVEAEFMYQLEAGAPAVDQQTLGITARRIGGGVVLSAARDRTGYWSKALGFTEPITSDLVGRILDVYRADGVPAATLQFAPDALPGDWDAIRRAHGLEETDQWIKLAAPLEDVSVVGTSDLRIAPVTQEDAERWAATVLDGFGMPPEGLTGMLASAVGHPQFHPYAAWDGDALVGGAILFVLDSVASFNAASVLPAHRNRGAQTALLGARAQRARDLGCRWAVAETGRPADGESNTSLNNLRRAGLTERYARSNFVWRA